MDLPAIALAAGSVGGLGEDSLPLMVTAGLIGGTITAGSRTGAYFPRVTVKSVTSTASSGTGVLGMPW